MTDKQPWKLVTFCVQSAQDAADVSKRNNGECSTSTRRAAGSMVTTVGGSAGISSSREAKQ